MSEDISEILPPKITFVFAGNESPLITFVTGAEPKLFGIFHTLSMVVLVILNVKKLRISLPT